MGTVKNLEHQEAIKKMQDLAEQIKVCMFCTKVDEMPFATRPMSTLEVDDEGVFWFFSADKSHKNWEIHQDRQVQLIYAKPNSSEFMSVYGKAQIVHDNTKIDELWNPMAKAWFKEGKMDPNLTLIMVKPEHAHYWDTLFGKMITLFSIAYSAISGKKADNGVEGELQLDD